MAEQAGIGRLPGGANILWEHVESSLTCSLGFFFATGSRYDPPGKAGTAHLVEHLVFKGTRNHTAASLARLVDRVGGDLNAWTDREEMAFTCSVPAEAWPTAVDALCELCLYPTFPPDEFEREKEVIRNEILASLEDPEELSYDYFLQNTSPGDWSRPVAGTEKSLASISLDDARHWWEQLGSTDRLTVCVSGGIDPDLINKALHERLEARTIPQKNVSAPSVYQPLTKRWAKKADFQMVQVIGSFAVPEPSTAREAAVWQIFSMLWGETMSSRLFQNVRERRGLCYSISSQLFDTEQVWNLQVFVSCAPENTKPVLDALQEEIDRLTLEPPTAEEWDDARRALRGGGILSAERTENRVGRLWRQYQSFGLIQGFNEALGILDSPVTEAEARFVLAQLSVPSLLVWGRVPRGLRLGADIS
jgi:predicted Zn-dependent peptidase